MTPGTFINPADGYPVTDRFGDTGTRDHFGLDIGTPAGTAIGPPGDGWTVAYVGPDSFPGQNRGNGNHLILEKDGVAVLYLHGDTVPPVTVGQTVDSGDTVFVTGNSGSSTGPHLHIEVLTNYDASEFPTFRSQGRDQTASHLDPEALFGREVDDFAFVGLESKNSYVREIQEVLVTQGLLTAEQVDGDFGPNTETAVRALQERLGVEADGIFGPGTRDAAEAQGVWVENGRPPVVLPEDPGSETPTDPAPQPDPSPRSDAFDTDGPFATTAVGDVLGGDTALGSLSAEQSYAFGRALFGDSQGAAALAFLDRELGTGDGVLVQRMAAMGLHEGQLHAGRANPDPSRGYNNGTFQLGGIGSTPTSTAANQQALFESGIDFLSRQGFDVDPDGVTLMDRDIIVHIGYMAERTGNAFDPQLPEDQLIRDMGDASITGEALVRLVHNDIQGGVRDIGVSVRDYTDAQTGLDVDLAVLEARQLEPDAVRREPAMPMLDARLHPSRYDTSRGPATSPAVAQWQAVLRAEGFLDDEPDGMFGDRTIQATRDAQRAAGLEPDGVVGRATWSAYSETLGQVVEGTTGPEPPAETSPAESLGDGAPEEYSVRQFDAVAAVGTWNPDAEQVAPSDDAARWVADTESPGDAGVQITFPGAVPDGEIVARPGSTLATMLEGMAADGETAQVRTATQVLPGGQSSTGTYVLIDEATILEHYDSVDAYNTDVRVNGALQTAPTNPQADAPTLVAARATLAANPVTVDLMDQVDGLVDNLLDTHTDDPATAREALYTRAEANGGMTPASLREVLAAQTPPITGMSDLETRTLANGVAVGNELRENNPDVAQARDQVRTAEEPGMNTPQTAASDRQLDAPDIGEGRVGGDGAVVGDGRGEPAIQVSPAASPTSIER